MATLQQLGARHIQNMSEATELEAHWGYADRAVPCTSDPGSCEYLDLVYWAHDMSMLYSGIFWATVGAILFVWALYRQAGRSSSVPVSPESTGRGGLTKLRRTLGAASRRYLLPDSVRLVFGRTTRLQVLILTVLVGYLTIWSFVGLYYRTWITPVKSLPGVYNRRSSLGPWSDRIGVLAYALTPLSIMLSSRESILSLITGVPYQSFNFLHRWLGYVIFLQSSLHTIAWCVVEIAYYQPQPTVSIEWVKQTYIVWGIVAMILLLLLVVLSTPWGIRLTGYETFRKLHYVLAMVYIGACWGHWKQLKCFLIPSLIFWFLDRGLRFVRTGFLHYHGLPDGGMGFRACQAVITTFPDAEHGDVYRLDLHNDQDPWAIGQHYYLCFTESSIWQSHPFTPLNAPVVEKGQVKHSYIVRAKGGETKKVAELAAKKLETAGRPRHASTPIILTGAYGENIMEKIEPSTNIVCVAGGTGITYVLPVLLELARSSLSPDRKMELIWAVRHVDNTEWVEEELDMLRQARKALNLKIRVFATRDANSRSPSLHDKEMNSPEGASKEVGPSSSSSSSSSIEAGCECGTDVPVAKIGGGTVDEDRHPNLPKLVSGFIDKTVRGPTVVIASGPGGMISDLRTIVAECNSASKVWKGEERFDVSLICDDRLEW